MSHTDHSPFAREIAAVTEWWREAGVDTNFDDDPTVWIAEKIEEEKPQKPARKAEVARSKLAEPVVQLGGDETEWPTELDAFQKWFAGDLAGELGGKAGVLPKGTPNASLMVIVPDPETSDSDGLLSGPTGKYFRAILAASGLDENEVYFASALPIAMPHPDWQDLAQRGLGKILRHHVALAAPKRIIALGSSILPLLGNNPAQGPAEIQKFQQDSTSTPLMAAWQIDRLRQRAAARKRFWKIWLDWIASDV